MVAMLTYTNKYGTQLFTLDVCLLLFCCGFKICLKYTLVNENTSHGHI